MEQIAKCEELFELLCGNYSGGILGKKAAQKIFYFFERKGIDLGLRYRIHYYGPYSSKLDNLMHILDNNGCIEINEDKSTHKITFVKRDSNASCLSNDELNIVRNVFENFSDKTPRQLEVLSTLDYVANYLLDSVSSDKDIIKKFREIKGDKFGETEIDQAIEQLKTQSFIA